MSRDRTGDMKGGQYGGGQQQPQYEMAQISQDDVGAFFEEVSSISDMIRKAQTNITQIDELHSRTLGIITEDENIKRQLEGITSETRGILTQIKDRIKTLEASNLKQAKSGNIAVRKAQTSNLRQKFLETLQNYQNVEYQNRQKYRQRMERQFKIVKPQATQEEIDSAIDNDDGGQVFAQSLMNSTRFGAAKDALREVQERHDDIKKIEKTIEELANLFHEMSIIVEAQDQTIVAIEQEATQVSTNMEQGAQHVDQALVSARAARKKKWYCLGIGIILLIILVVVIYLLVIKPAIDKNKQQK